MTPIRTLIAGAAVLALTAIVPSATKAYSTYSKWGTLNVPFYVNPNNSDVSDSAAISALQGAMEVWNTQSGTPFQFSYAGQVATTTTGYDKKNVILFRNTSNGLALASTYSWTSNNILVDSDIVYWDGGFKFFTGSSGCSSGAYIEDIGAHELGHAMGLSHSSTSEATMYGSYGTCSQKQRTLDSDDIAGAKKLYGGSTGTDTAPITTILSPANGQSVAAGTTVTFSGSATDTPDGDVSSYISWQSNIDGKIGSGAKFSRTLTAGSHTITATATDSTGNTSSANITLKVTSTTNTAPAVSISNPNNGAAVPAGTSMTFSGSANDTEDGSLTTKLVWRSNIDGQIGTGGSFSRTLTAGSHTITATATDAGGLTGQKSVTVSVSSTSTSTSPKLTARGYKDKGLQKADLSWSGLDATSVDIYRNGTKIANTPNQGALTDAIDERGNGSYTYKVCAAGTSTCTNQVSISF